MISGPTHSGRAVLHATWNAANRSRLRKNEVTFDELSPLIDQSLCNRMRVLVTAPELDLDMEIGIHTMSNPQYLHSIEYIAFCLG